MFANFCMTNGGYMSMLVRQTKQLEEVQDTPTPEPFPSSKSALAQGIEQRNELPDLVLGVVKCTTSLQGVLPGHSPITEPVELPQPKPTAEVVDIKVATPKQKVNKKQTKPSKTRHDKVDDSVAYEAWLRGYASLCQDHNIAQLAGRTKANTVDGRSVKVNKVLACFLEPGDVWGGEKVYADLFGPPTDGVADHRNYPTRWKYRKREEKSQAARVALAHESVPVSEVWEASSYMRSKGNIQGFEGFARPPSLSDLWNKHRLDLVMGRLQGPTLHETKELEGYTFYLSQEYAMTEPCYRVQEPSGRRFAFSFKFTHKKESYREAGAGALQRIHNLTMRLFQPPWEVVDTKSLPSSELTQYATHVEVAKETVKALAEAYQTINPANDSATESIKVNPQYVLPRTDDSRAYNRWLMVRERTPDRPLNWTVYRNITGQGLLKIAMLKGAELRYKWSEVYKAKNEAFTEYLKKSEIKGRLCGMSQSQLKSYMRWWLYNTEALEPNQKKSVFVPISHDPCQQMLAFWWYQCACKRITNEQFCSIANRIKDFRTRAIDKMLEDHKRLPALPPPPAIPFVTEVAAKIEQDGEVITEAQWKNFVAIVDEEDSFGGKTKLPPRAFYEHPSGLFLPDELRKDPEIGDYLSVTGLKLPAPQVAERVIEVHQTVTQTKPGVLERVGYKLQELGEFLATIAPK